MTTVLTNAHLASSQEADDGVTYTVIVDGPTITSVTPTTSRECSPAIAPEDHVIDLSGSWVMPGMTSAHVHAEYRDLDLVDPYTGRETRPGVLMAIAVATARTMVESGFTGFVGAGCSNDIDVQLNAAIQAGIVVGPRMVRGSGYGSFGHGAAVAITVVNDLIDHGADFIKVFATDGHGAPEGRDGGIDRAELAAIVDTAHARGKRVRTHNVYRNKIREAIEVGVDLIDHGDEVDEESIVMMAERGVYWVPSAHYLRVLTRAAPGEASPSEVEAAHRYLGRMGDMLLQADEAGVKILLGDDYGIRIMPHALGMYSSEMQTYLQLGCSPSSIFRWATANGADLLGLGDSGGAVAVGRVADLVAVDGNPLSDLGLLADPVAHIPLVMKDGAVVKSCFVPTRRAA